MKKARLFIALTAAGLLVFLIRLMGRGKGTSLPGRVALIIYPGLIGHLAARVKKGIIVVTGTNGKTTTNNMIARILEAGGHRVLINREGANLITGIATAFARNMDIFNKQRFDYACLEVDEAAFPGVVDRVRPQCVVITNFFRDQLDRYGELDKTIALVRNALKGMEGVRLVLNADDPLVAQMSRSTGLQSVFYGLARHGGVTRQGAAAREAKFCPLCGRELAYRFYHYSQLGSYSCPGCGFARPDPDVEGDSPRLGGAHTQCRVKFRLGSAVSLEVPVYGLYNLYNALAAYTTALLLNVDPLEAAGFLKGYRPATGRMERFDYRGKPVYLNLVKNPTGFNEGIGALVEMSRPDLDVMIAINDNDADGRDISWLWDVDFELLADCQERIGKFVCAGSRAGEMALRLKYAGVGESRLVVEEDFNEAVSGVLGGGAGKACILATYTALWPVERILSGHAKRDYTQADHMPHVS